MSAADDVEEWVSDPMLAALVEEVRAYGSGPVPVPGIALANVLATGLGIPTGSPSGYPANPLPASAGTGARSWRNRIQGRSVRVALGTAVLGLSLLGTGAAGALPEPVQAIVEDAVGIVGIELPVAGASSAEPASGGEEPARLPGPINGGEADAPPVGSPGGASDDGRPNGEGPRPDQGDADDGTSDANPVTGNDNQGSASVPGNQGGNGQGTGNPGSDNQGNNGQDSDNQDSDNQDSNGRGNGSVPTNQGNGNQGNGQSNGSIPADEGDYQGPISSLGNLGISGQGNAIGGDNGSRGNAGQVNG